MKANLYAFSLIILSVALAAPRVMAVEAVVPRDAAGLDLFQAMDAGLVDVKFVALGPDKANVMVKNLGDKPVLVRLPETFAGVPVLGQFGGGGMGGGGMGGGGMGGGGMGGGGMGGGQAMGGGGMGGGGMGGGMGGGGMGGGMGGGGGMFQIAPQRMSKISVTTVCLEHGKPDPTAKMQYKMVPLEQVTKDPAVKKICQELGSGQVPQPVAQAAAWHFTDRLSWQELAAKNRVESQYTGNVPFFNAEQLQKASTFVSIIQSAVHAETQHGTERLSGGDSYSSSSVDQ